MGYICEREQNENRKQKNGEMNRKTIKIGVAVKVALGMFLFSVVSALIMRIVLMLTMRSVLNGLPAAEIARVQNDFSLMIRACALGVFGVSIPYQHFIWKSNYKAGYPAQRHLLNKWLLVGSIPTPNK